MPLAIFDIDGTLTRTKALDDDCYVRAVEAGLGVSGFDTDWANYAHATDSGLLDEIARRTLGRGPTPEEWLRVRRVFLDLLATAAGRAGAVTPVPGAGTLLALLASRGWGVALATGAWRPSATIKLSAAGLAWEALPLATSDDHAERAEIVKRAAARALEKEVGGVATPDPEEALLLARARWGSVVAVGDGLWDLRAARALGVGFVGVAEGDGRARLESEGAPEVLADFADAMGAYEALRRAAR